MRGSFAAGSAGRAPRPAACRIRWTPCPHRLCEAPGDRGGHAGMASPPPYSAAKIDAAMRIQTRPSSSRFMPRRNALILGFGMRAPHDLRCPPPDPPMDEDSRLAMRPRCASHSVPPRMETA